MALLVMFFAVSNGGAVSTGAESPLSPLPSSAPPPAQASIVNANGAKGRRRERVRIVADSRMCTERIERGGDIEAFTAKSNRARGSDVVATPHFARTTQRELTRAARSRGQPDRC